MQLARNNRQSLALYEKENSALKIKLVLVGDGGVGKTTFINRHRIGEFEKRYIATLGVELTPLPFYFKNSKGERKNVVFNIWDCAGQERFSGLKDGYYIGAQCAVVMFDMTSKVSLKSVPSYLHDLKRVAPNIPTVICGNKNDCKGQNARKMFFDLYAGKSEHWLYEMSAKSNYNFEKPFLYLARKVLKDETLTFDEAINAPIVEA